MAHLLNFRDNIEAFNFALFNCRSCLSCTRCLWSDIFPTEHEFFRYLIKMEKSLESWKLLKLLNPTLEPATKWWIIVASAPRPYLSRENPLIDVSAGAGHVKVASDAFLWRDLDQYPRSVWIMVRQRNRWIYSARSPSLLVMYNEHSKKSRAPREFLSAKSQWHIDNPGTGRSKFLIGGG